MYVEVLANKLPVLNYYFECLEFKNNHLEDKMTSTTFFQQSVLHLTASYCYYKNKPILPSLYYNLVSSAALLEHLCWWLEEL